MALSKSRRFEIFKRDGFVCQYCGHRPDDGLTILEVDHIEPRSLGGTDDELNLITSCQECNSGKNARRLADVHPRPDADLKYLQLQQEIGEAKRYQRSLALREEAQEEIISMLTLLWGGLTEDALDWHPHPRVIRQFLAKYPPEIVEAGLRDIAPKVVTNYIKGSWVPYCWAVMRKLWESDDEDA